MISIGYIIHEPKSSACLPQIIGGQVRFPVRINRNGVDVVGVCVGKDAPWRSLNHQLHGAQDGDAESIDGAGVLEQSAVLLQVVAFRSLVSFRHFPELDRLVCKANKSV